MSYSDTKIKIENTETEVGGNESSISNGFIYMDMNVYNEDEESLDSIEIKQEDEDEEEEEGKYQNEEHFEENLPLHSLKNLANRSQDGESNYKKKIKSDFVGDSESFQKENVSEVKSTENLEIKRYKLRTRNLKEAGDGNLFECQLQNEKITKFLNRKKTNICIKCGETFIDKVDLAKHKSENKVKCLHCRKCFCSKELLALHTCKNSLKPSKNKLDCKICKESFSDKSQLETHNGASFKCENCKRIFCEKMKLESHILQNQCMNNDVFTCDICKRTFAQINTLKKHIISHMKNSFVCHYCFEIFESSDILNKHVCKSKAKYSFTCHICNKTFQLKNRLRIHMTQHNQFLCSACDKFFDSQDSLNKHFKEENCLYEKFENGKDEVKDGSYQTNSEGHIGVGLMKCRKCKKVFSDLLKFSMHVNESECQKENSVRKKNKYECDTCGSQFVKLAKLQIHILNAHHGVIYQCEKCNFKFPSQEDRDAHVTNGNCKSEDPCTCKTCGKVFAKKDYLKKHQYMHMNVLFKCKYCYCAFMKEKSYKRHMEKMNCSKSARKIKMAEFNFKKCRICDVEFETEEVLIQHFREQHQGEEPHQCFCCDSKLPTSRDLQNHIHHHNIQKYTCHLCGKPYTSQEGFRKHRLKHKGAEFKCRFCESEFLNEGRYKFHEKTCKKNPETGYEPSRDKPKKKDERPKQSRQLHWESKIIMKHLRGDPKSLIDNQKGAWENLNDHLMASTFFDEPETDSSTNERGWFDNYYKTEEDDIAFGLKKDAETIRQDCDSDFDVPEFLQSGSIVKKKKAGGSMVPSTAPVATVHPNRAEDYEMNGGIENESSSEKSTSDSSEDEGVEDIELPIDYNPKKCRLCVITFGQEYELLHHFIKVHPGEYAHECPNCEVQSPLFAQLKEHMKTHGIGMGVYNCDNCSKKFKSEKKMKTHNIRCKGMNAIDTNDSHGKTVAQSGEDHCKRCGKKFHTKFGYRRHKQLCKGKKKKNKIPEKSFSHVRNQKAKEEKEMEEGNVDFQMSEPEDEVKVQPVTRSFAEEVNTTSEPVTKEKKKPAEIKDSYMGEPPMDSFPCRLCDKKFQYERGIVMHFKSAHPGNKPLICHVCNMHLADKLKEHLKTHGIGEEFICELCGKRFNQKFLSKIHEMWHQGIEYKCNNCKQKFLNKEKMDKHIGENRCSNRQSLMRLPCDICGKSYRSKFGLSKHYITHTPKELRPVKNRMNCEYCGNWFENNNGLQRHRRIHTGERPFCCRFCPKAFAQEGNCKAHERIHTGESKPRKKKTSTTLPPVPVPPLQNSIHPSPPLPPPPSVVETITYPEHVNLYCGT